MTLLIGVLIGAIMIIGMVVQSKLKSKFKKYSQTPISSNLTGREIAEQMLADNGITDVRVISVNGQLTDHYNPINKTVNLHVHNTVISEHLLRNVLSS